MKCDAFRRFRHLKGTFLRGTHSALIVSHFCTLRLLFNEWLKNDLFCCLSHNSRRVPRGHVVASPLAHVVNVKLADFLLHHLCRYAQLHNCISGFRRIHASNSKTTP